MVVFDMGVAVPMIVIGFIFVFVFSNQEGNFLKGIASSGANFITITLSGINAFSDLVSYIRLFAVGLASFKIAESFNNIAAGFGFDTFGGIAMTIFCPPSRSWVEFDHGAHVGPGSRGTVESIRVLRTSGDRMVGDALPSL
jgi:hypothetical protein